MIFEVSAPSDAEGVIALLALDAGTFHHHSVSAFYFLAPSQSLSSEVAPFFFKLLLKVASPLIKPESRLKQSTTCQKDTTYEPHILKSFKHMLHKPE